MSADGAILAMEQNGFVQVMECITYKLFTDFLAVNYVDVTEKINKKYKLILYAFNNNNFFSINNFTIN